MKKIKNFEEFSNNDKIEEGMKNWLAAFSIMVSMGLVPNDVKAGNEKQKQEFVEKQPEAKRVAIQLVQYMKDHKIKSPEFAFEQMIKQAKIDIEFEEVEKHLEKKGNSYTIADSK